ncbi:MAG: beta-galactosidase, partial [Umezawaea sp.]
FSWGELEPEEGRFEFGWLDRVLDLLHEGGVRVDLATATASPPPWLTTAYPDLLPVRADGVRFTHGSRQEYCPSSPVYRAKAVALATALAERYRDHPALAAWHVGNEYGCHVARCYCDRCAEAFRDWLRRRHGDLDALNEAWATAFWSQHYTAWDQVLPPRVTPTFGNPGHLLDFDRFCSDALLELYKAERDVLHATTPGVPVTTNFMVGWTFDALDYWAWAAEVDFVSNDHYTRSASADRHVELAMAADLTRGLAGGRPWLLMEHSTSAVNWQPRNIAKLPGELRRHSFAHTARGADGTLFFPWRQSRAGAERYHSAMVPHAGTETKVYREVCEVGAEYAKLDELLGSTVDAPVAIVYDWQSRWLSGQEAHPTQGFSYQDNVFALYRQLWAAGVTVDFVPPSADLTSYRLVVVPALYSVTDADAARFAEYVDGGGHVLVTYMSGLTDERGHVRLGGYPGAFRDLLGVWTEEFFPLREDEEVRLDDGGVATVWTELLHTRGAEVVSTYADGPLPGVPSVTRNRRGSGTAWYLACGLGDDGLRRLVDAVLEHAGVPAAPGLEIVRRRGDRHGDAVSWLVAVNHEEHDVTLPATGVELLSGSRVDSSLVVPAGAVVVLREEV